MHHKTYTATPSTTEHKWWIVDAEGQTLGRLASKVAPILRGKHKTTFTPNIDTGDYVIIINADKIAVTGNRLDDKVYYHHTPYPGGLKQITLKDNLARFPDRPITMAIKGMLPKTKLAREQIKKLKVYAGTEHPHTAQQPEPLTFEK